LLNAQLQESLAQFDILSKQATLNKITAVN